MNPALNAQMASTILDERIREAERARRTQMSRRAERAEHYANVTVRLANASDDAGLRRLEELEGRRLPFEPTLVAEVDGHILAARTILKRKAIADPFRPTRQLVEMLDLRSVHLRQRPLRSAGARFGRLVHAVTAPIRS